MGHHEAAITQCRSSKLRFENWPMCRLLSEFVTHTLSHHSLNMDLFFTIAFREESASHYSYLNCSSEIRLCLGD